MEYYSDEELLYLIHCGSETALFLLLESYYKRIRKWLLPFYKYQYQGVEFDHLVQVAMGYWHVHLIIIEKIAKHLCAHF